jgi:2-iminoacetate synthase ThiH
VSEGQINEFCTRKTITPIIREVMAASKMRQEDVPESVREKVNIPSKVGSNLCTYHCQICKFFESHETMKMARKAQVVKVEVHSCSILPLLQY